MNARWLRLSMGLILLLALAGTIQSAEPPAKPALNIVFITADDMNHDSAGCYGCPIRDLTPNLDRLAGEGMRFNYAYSTVAVCQPVRQIMHTGLYPHRNGSMGFFPLKPEVRTLNQQLHAAGYLISMIGKNPHYQPAENFCVDFEETQISRSPAKLAEATTKFIAMAREKGRPFFHHVNCTDPHRPFIGAGGPDDLAHGDAPSRVIRPEEVNGVPGFLEDLADIRREVSQYFTSVRRLDDCVGAVLGALAASGEAERTLVMFYGGDHGMSFPFAKSNDYEDSSRGALILRWPGTIKPGGVDRDHMVATIDFTPTLLDAAGLPAIPDIDGRSFLPAMKGGKMDGWDRVFTFYNQNSGHQWLPMRCIRTKDRSYIWNAWSDAKTEYHAENMAGMTWKAMLAAATTNADIRARTDFYLHRVPEEFYDMSSDRYERRNLIADPARRGEIDALRGELLSLLKRTGDPLAAAFANRDRPEVLAAALEKLSEEYATGPGSKKKGRATAPAAREKGGAAATGSRGDLIALVLPEHVSAGKTAAVLIRHHVAAEGEAITVTLKDGANARLDRKVIHVKGDGEASVEFAVPSAMAGKSVRMAAFVGEDFATTPQQIQGQPIRVTE